MAQKLRTFVKNTLLGMLGLLLSMAYFVAIPPRALALQLQDRSLYIKDSRLGVTTDHTFRFSYVSPQAVGSVMFEYCTSPFLELTCDAPPGMNATGAALTEQSGEAGYFRSEEHTSE